MKMMSFVYKLRSFKTYLNNAFRFSGSSARPAYPGFIVINIPIVDIRFTLSPNIKHVFLFALIESNTDFT